MNNKLIAGEIIDEKITFTISQICQQCDIPKELLLQMMEHGLFEFYQQDQDEYRIDINGLKQIEIAFHLHKDLEINIPGIAVIIELRDELEQLRTELNFLHKHFQSYEENK